ncbi:MAG: ROK family protein [Nitrospirae bacterium]|nr:ROK family protein [Nitrospirota bacterium]
MRIGIDLGGTKIEAIALGGGGETLDRRRIPTPRNDYAGTVRAVVELVQGIESQVGATGTVGVGIPGIVSPATGLVKNANSTWLIGHPLDRDLSDRLDRPVRLENDANCFALSEATDGAGAGAAVVFGVILGTGVGGGIVVDGRVISGANAIAGEWGHNPLPAPRDDERPGPPCYCGRNGCIETFLSGPALENQYAERSGAHLKADEIAALAMSGNSGAVPVLSRYAERLSRALAGVINIVDPHVIVLGGGVSNIESLCDGVPRLWASHVFSDHVNTKLRRAVHGDSSGVRGAAWLWPASR